MIRVLAARMTQIAPVLLLLCSLEISHLTWNHFSYLPQLMMFGGPVGLFFITSLVSFPFSVLPLTIAEQVFSSRRPSVRSYLIGLAGLSAAWATGYWVGAISQSLIYWLGLTPLLVIKVSSNGAIVAGVLIFVNIFVFDFFYYWFHRMQHAVPILWRFHAVHHAIRDLNSVMSFHHPIEEYLRIIPISLSLAALVRFDEIPYIAIISGFVGSWGQFLHADTKVNLGPVRHLIADNYYHRIHHSLMREHFNMNFAAYCPFWDLVFGTQRMPKNGEYPPVGLPSRPNGVEVKDYVFGVANSSRLPIAVRNEFRTNSTS